MSLTWVWPWALVLTLCVPLMIVLHILAERRRVAWRLALGQQALVRALLPAGDVGRRAALMGVWCAALGLVVVGLARPTWGESTELTETQGVSVVFVLDVSESMNAADVLPTRLTRAKLLIREQMQTLAGSEFGLVIYAGDAFTAFPLTTDAPSAQVFLDAVTTRSVSRQGTDVGPALQLALQSFDDRPAGRLVVLLTDGEDFGTSTAQGVAALRQAGVTLHVVGVGTVEGTTIPVLNEQGAEVGRKVDQTGQLVVTQLDAPLLADIAADGGGRVFFLGADAGVEAQLQQTLAGATSSGLQRQETTRGIERFGLFVGLAVALLALEMLLPQAREHGPGVA